MKRTTILVMILATCGCSPRFFNPTTLPIPPDSPLQVILKGEPVPVRRLGEIPAAVTRVIVDRIAYDPRIADANEQWEPTDVTTTTAPCRRFVTAAHVGSNWVLLYEHGGRGYHQHLVIVEQTSTTPTVTYWGTGYACKPGTFACSAGDVDVAALTTAIEKGWFGPNEVASDRCR